MRSFYSPLGISAPFYGYLKLLKLHRTERSRIKDVRSENRTQDLLHEARALTDCAILASRLTCRSMDIEVVNQNQTKVIKLHLPKDEDMYNNKCRVAKN